MPYWSRAPPPSVAGWPKRIGRAHSAQRPDEITSRCRHSMRWRGVPDLWNKDCGKLCVTELRRCCQVAGDRTFDTFARVRAPSALSERRSLSV